jgi:hypothetical protein
MRSAWGRRRRRREREREGDTEQTMAAIASDLPGSMLKTDASSAATITACQGT